MSYKVTHALTTDSETLLLKTTEADVRNKPGIEMLRSASVGKARNCPVNGELPGAGPRGGALLRGSEPAPPAHRTWWASRKQCGARPRGHKGSRAGRGGVPNQPGDRASAACVGGAASGRRGVPQKG